MAAPYRAKIPAMRGVDLGSWTARLAEATAVFGRSVEVNGLALATERLQHDGSRESATRVMRCADGWVAVTMAREWDRDAVPAWIGAEPTWEAITAAVAARPADELVAGAELLGLAVGVLGERTDGAATITRFAPPVGSGVGPLTGASTGDRAGPLAERLAGPGSGPHLGPPAGRLTGSSVGPRAGHAAGPGVGGSAAAQVGAGPDRLAGASGVPVGWGGARRHRVLDLSALWAGPLCAALLAEAGVDVVKVESASRRDASRQGNPGLFKRLNGAKRTVVLDLETPAGRERLAELVGLADVVVESSRPRALEQMGVVAAELLSCGSTPKVWVSITGHGRSSNRAGFGDDAAFAGGLADRTSEVPGLWGDAAADPLSGLVAATLAAEALVTGGRVLIDVSMAGVAAELGPGLPAALPLPGPWSAWVGSGEGEGHGVARGQRGMSGAGGPVCGDVDADLGVDAGVDVDALVSEWTDR